MEFLSARTLSVFLGLELPVLQTMHQDYLLGLSMAIDKGHEVLSLDKGDRGVTLAVWRGGAGVIPYARYHVGW